MLKNARKEPNSLPVLQVNNSCRCSGRPCACIGAITGNKNFFMSMKSEEFDPTRITGFDALWASMMKARCSTDWKDSVASFVLNGVERISDMEQECLNGPKKMRNPIIFTLYSPKKREISSVCFSDRVYQRSVNDNALYPIMTKSFIYDNWACQKGKGTDKARARLKKFMHSYYVNYGNKGYFAQFDISGYYPNMDHEYIENMFRTKLPGNVYELVEDILHSQYPQEKGYNPGSQMIQIAGISALDSMDHYIKEQLHIKYYLRYMDDFILIHESKEYLEFCMRSINDYLVRRKFAINEKKTRIFPLSDGILFLGFYFRMSKTGKVYLHVNPKNVKAKRKNLRRLVKKCKRGDLPKESVDNSYQSWKNHVCKGSSYKLIERMDKYYKELWEENNEGIQTDFPD